MAEPDITSKYMAREHLNALLKLFGIPNAVVLEHVDSVQARVKEYQGDSSAKVKIDGKEIILHIEVQTTDSRQPMWARVANYCGHLMLVHQLPVYCVVLYLRPNAGRRDRGTFGYDATDFKYLLQYKVVRLAEVDGASILASGEPGLLPYTPLMKAPVDMAGDAWLRRCAEKAEATLENNPERANLLTAFAVFAELLHSKSTIASLITEVIMQESTLLQPYFEKEREAGRKQGLEQGIERGMERGIERGIEQGAKESTIKNTLAVLSAKFSPDTVKALAPALQRITDLQRLELLLLAAVQAESLDSFARSLNR